MSSTISNGAADRKPTKRAFYADPNRKPCVSPPNMQAIPDELRDVDRWVLWRLVPKRDRKGGGKWDKVPFQPSGKAAKSNDPRTWTTFTEAVAAYGAGDFDGVGFVLGGAYAGVDLDDVRDPTTRKLTQFAKQLGKQFGTYAEVSPSGTGVKLIGRGKWNGNWHRKPLPDGGEVEVYDHGRFFTVTGDMIDGPVADVQQQLDELAAEFATPDARHAGLPEEGQRHDLTDDELVRRAGRAENGAQLKKLWRGKWSGYKSRSEADLALCGMLALWSGGDAARIDRLFRRSKLMREKWDTKRGETTYGQRTIAKALHGRSTFNRPAGVGPPPAVSAPGQPTSGVNGRMSATDILVGIGTSYELWHDAKDRAYATVGRLSHPVHSTAFRRLLLNEYRIRTGGKVPNNDATSNALRVIDAKAVCDGPEYEAHVRVAGHESRVYLHLADRDSTVIEIDADGWRVCDTPPVRFRKPSGMLPLPVPVEGGALAELRRFLNVPDDDAFALVTGWLVGTFNTAGPFPLLVLLGEQGSAKTTTARVLKRLIDPGEADLRSEPREVRDLMIAARNGWGLAYDNLSYLTPWLSDGLCRLATGGGFGTRVLYTDDDEMIFDAKRPVMLNGIEDFVTRADLLERSILLRHPTIPDGRRRPESEFWAAFEAARPQLLGAVLDRVSAGLRELPRVRLDCLPRMADFARFAVACERGAGKQPRFLAAYADNQAEAHEQALDASPVTPALVEHMCERDEWGGTATELLAQLARTLPTRGIDTPIYPHGWPKGANALTNCLHRLVPNLRRVHRLNVDCGRTNHGRFIRITRLPDGLGDSSSPPSPPYTGPDSAGAGGDDRGESGPSPDRHPANGKSVGKRGSARGGDDGDDGDGLFPRPWGPTGRHVAGPGDTFKRDPRRRRGRDEFEVP